MWVDDDPHFDLDYHLRHTALPAPGSEEEPGGLAESIRAENSPNIRDVRR